MDRTSEVYFEYTITTYALPVRETDGAWMGNYIITQGTQELQRVSVVNHCDSEAEANEMAMRIAKEHLDQRRQA